MLVLGVFVSGSGALLFSLLMYKCSLPISMLKKWPGGLAGQRVHISSSSRVQMSGGDKVVIIECNTEVATKMEIE